MAWEKRRRRRYYYHKRREGDRVTSVYLGRGDLAHFYAQAAQRDQRRRAQTRRHAREVCAEVDQLDQTLDALQTITATLVQATLIAEGFHLHHGQWRKNKRGRPHG